jgi:uncharacterized membrane protein
MLVTIPIGLWVFSFFCDLMGMSNPDPEWNTVALYTMGGGIIGALLAAVAGFIDLLSLPPGPRATGIKHMAINLTIVVLYVINFWMRTEGPAGPGNLVWLSLLTILLLLVSGWLGGKLVYEYGVAVDVPRDPMRR